MARTTEAGPKPRNDAYTGLLAISLLALLGGCVLMYLDHEELGKAPAKSELTVTVPGTSAPGKGSTLPPKVDPAGLGGAPAPIEEKK